jgi:quercetin dioxygenase-like cupin family protein
MRSKRFLLTLLAAIALISIAGAGVVQATPSSGVTTTTFAIGAFDEIDAKIVDPKFQVRISTKGTSDVHVLENRLAPGATFGWHSHPGPSLVVVKTGALWVYTADEPGCTPEIVQAGHGFVDGGSDVHMVRNEGPVETVVYVVSIVPTGATRRIDQPAPAGCPS